MKANDPYSGNQNGETKTKTAKPCMHVPTYGARKTDNKSLKSIIMARFGIQPNSEQSLLCCWLMFDNDGSVGECRKAMNTDLLDAIDGRRRGPQGREERKNAAHPFRGYLVRGSGGSRLCIIYKFLPLLYACIVYLSTSSGSNVNRDKVFEQEKLLLLDWRH